MSENSTDSSATPAEVDAMSSVDPLAPQSAPEPEGSDDQAQESDGIDWKAKSREWEKRAKANAQAAKRLEEIEDAKKSEIERATGKQQRAEKERDDAVAKLLRYEVATTAGLPMSVAHRLQGSTKEELEADAKELSTLLADKRDAERKAATVDPTAGRTTTAGASTAEQFADLFKR